MAIFCPYCGSEAEFVDSARVYRGKSYGMIYDCRACDAYVGVHKGTTHALGTMANKELRVWRMRAHAAFDPLWQRGAMNRHAAYSYMQFLMGMTPEQAHISRFNVEQCERLVTLLNKSKAPQKERVGVTKRTDHSLLDCCWHLAPWDHCEHTRAAA